MRGFFVSVYFVISVKQTRMNTSAVTQLYWLKQNNDDQNTIIYVALYKQSLFNNCCYPQKARPAQYNPLAFAPFDCL
ncbi:hypothetical protein TUM4249_21510 [Shewanella sp. KT0246]|nr:hypothetical protein TUM4249_21510 [Shewanella sp. KT0246]